jgi:hypothetical protein
MKRKLGRPPGTPDKEKRMRTRHERQVTDKPLTSFEVTGILKEELFITSYEKGILEKGGKIEINLETLTRIVNCFHEVPAQAYVDMKARQIKTQLELQELQCKLEK